MIAVVLALVVAVATWGEGGMSPGSLLVQHLALAGLLAYATVTRPGASAADRGPAAAWLCFAAAAVAGAFVAPYGYAAWLVIVEILAFGAVAWIAASHAGLLERVLPAAIAVLAFVHGLAAVAQKAMGDTRPASTFLNPNHLGAWLAAAALFLAGIVAARDGSRPARLAYAAAAAAALAGVFVTGSRGAVLGLAAGGGTLAAASWAGLPTRARRVMIGTAAVVVLGGAIGVAVRFHAADDPYSFHRTRIWRAVLSGALRSPWRGTGPGQFAAASANLNFPLEDAPLRFERSFRTPHSDVLRAICEFGIPAGALAAASVALMASSFWRRRAAASPVSRGAFAALVAFAAQGIVDDLSTRPAITIAAAAFAGLVVARPRDPRASRPGRGARAVVALLAVMALGAGEISGFLAWRAARALPPGRLDDAGIERLRLAISWNPMQPDTWRRLAEHLADSGRTWTIEEYAAAREAAERASRLDPGDAVYARACARVEATACLTIFPFQSTRARAGTLYEQAEELAKTDAAIPLEAARFLLRAGDPDGARRAAERALRIEPRAATPRVWLAKALLEKDGAAAVPRVLRLADEAVALALPEGALPGSSYEAALRGLEPGLVARVRDEARSAAAAQTP